MAEKPAPSWTLAVRGDSMRFLLKAGDLIQVRRAPLVELRAGDLAVVLDWREGPPEYVVHRLLRRSRRGGALFAVTKGDANLLPDPPSPESAVVGVVAAARVGGVWREFGPQGRPGGLALAVLGAPVYRGLAAADRLFEAALRLGWTRLPLPRRARGVLLGLLAWRERATAGAYERLQALGARLTCGAETTAPPVADEPRAVFGILDGDQAWSGRISVEGDVFVPPGVTLRIEPGSEIVFRADSQWDCLRECRIWKGWPQDLEGKARLLIGGRLLAEGTDAAPISFGGAPWAGIHFVTDSWGSRLTNVRAAGSLCAAVSLHDSAQTAITSSRLSDCESGVALLGRGASAELADCVLERCIRRGLSCDGGALQARRVAVRDCGEIGVFVDGGALDLEDCELSGSPVGVAHLGGSARLTRVSVARAAKAAFELGGGEYELRGASAADCGDALSLAGGRLSLDAFSASGCGSGVSLRGGDLTWLGGSVAGGRFGLASADARARVEGVSFHDQASAACRSEGGALSLRAVRVERAALGLASAGPLDAEDLGFDGCARGVEASAGRLSWRGGFLRGGGGLILSPGVAARIADVSFEDGPGNPLFLEEAELSGRGLRISGWPDGGAVALRPRRLELDDCAFSASRFGLDVSGGSADLRGLGFDGCADRALGVDSGAHVRAEGLTVRGGGDGLAARGAELDIDGYQAAGHAGAAVRADEARLALRRGSFDGGEAGVLAKRGTTRLDGCVWRGQRGPAVFQNGGTLAISDASIEGPGTGVRVVAGSLELRKSRLAGPRLRVECEGSAVLENVHLEGESGGVRFDGTSFGLSDVKISGAAGVELPRGRLVWRSGLLSGAGLSVGSGAEALLEDVDVEGVAGHGAEVSGGRLTASRCRLTDVAEAGVRVSAGGGVSLTDCSLRRLRYGVGAAGGDARLENVRITEASAVGFSAEGGRHRLERVAFHGCADRVHADGGAVVEFVENAGAGGGAAAALKRALRAVVLSTRRLPLLGTAYRSAYTVPVRAIQAWAALDGNTAALYAHRSWTRRDWDPGLSDVDLLLAARDLSGDGGRRWLERFWARFALLKGAFPFMGECLVAEREEFDGYALWGGFRARGFADSLSPLRGRPPSPRVRPASPKAALEPLGELAHAYTRLMSSALWRPEPSQAGRAAARNAALDVLRIASADARRGPSELAPREAALAAAGSSGSTWRAPLEALAAAESPRARAELCAAGLSSLHEAAASALVSWPAAGDSALSRILCAAECSPAGDVELQRRRSLAEEYARACGGALVAGCADDVYRTCLVLDDGAASMEALAGVFEGLSRLLALRGEPATLPLVLTASAWKVWSRLAYLESPARFLEPGAGSGDFLVRAGAAAPGAWQYAWGRERLTPVPAPDDLVLDLARESLAALRCGWRWQASEASPLSRGYVQHYLLGRVMGLRLLLERGVAASFFALEPLRARYAREFPERAPALESLWTHLAERDGPAPWTELYAWTDAELRASR